MNTRTTAAILLLVPAISLAQVPVDDNGNIVGQYESQSDIMSIGDDGFARLSQVELQDLVGPIALYPDDLLAIVLPASAYPLQIVEAARFLEALKIDATLQPDADWDDSVVALVNYPEVIQLLNEDLDWTLRLGEAVVAQQGDVVAAVEAFRDRAYAAGNLKSDSYQVVSNDDGVINISPAADDVIYVPYYEPASVVYYQPRPAYHYYPTAYPVYYYPYASNYHFNSGFFWGVTTAFTIGWMSDSLHVYHHSYYGHPYYGHSYWNHWYYRSPSIGVYNTTYVNNNYNNDHYSHGDRWHAQESRREYVRREGYSRDERRGESYRSNGHDTGPRVNKPRQIEPVSFRERDTQQVARGANGQANGQANFASGESFANRSTVERSRDVRRQDTPAQPSDTRRQETVSTTRNTRQQAPIGPATRQPVVASNETRQQVPVRTETRQQVPVRTETRQQVPVRTETRQQTPVRTETRQQVPVRTESRQPAPTQAARAPAPQQSRATESQTRPKPSSSSQPRSQQKSSSGSNAQSHGRPRNRDR